MAHRPRGVIYRMGAMEGYTCACKPTDDLFALQRMRGAMQKCFQGYKMQLIDYWPCVIVCRPIGFGWLA